MSGKDITAHEKSSRLSAGSIIGSILRAIVKVLVFFLKILFKLCRAFGLWIPLIYIIFGVIMFFAVGFDPFKFDTLGTLYLCGFIACVIGAAVIAVRNVIIKPVKSIYQGYKHPFWEKKVSDDGLIESELARIRRQKREDKFTPPEIEKFKPEKTVDRYGDLLATISNFEPTVVSDSERKKQDWVSEKNKTVNQTQSKIEIRNKEIPKVYLSKLQPDVLVHEYEDRFELHKMNGNTPILMGVEYK